LRIREEIWALCIRLPPPKDESPPTPTDTSQQATHQFRQVT
jgi:hypothetical protein